MGCRPTRFEEIKDRAGRIAIDIAGPSAADVDRSARFPAETIDALRCEGLLSASVPVEHGGLGCSTAEVAEICRSLAARCASSAAIYAMHQIQLHCIARHAGQQPHFSAFLKRSVQEQPLVASATSEKGIGGDLGKSRAAVVPEGDRFALRKECPSVSYAEDTEYILVTARRAPDAAAGDQVLILLAREDWRFEHLGGWDPMGMRGMRSPALTLSACGYSRQILGESFRTIAAQSMVPYTHILWAACWTGIASAAVRTALRATKARSGSGSGPSGNFRDRDLVSSVEELQVLDALLQRAVEDHDRAWSARSAASHRGTAAAALNSNGLKISASEMATRICLAALRACGIAGYLEDSEHSVARNVRDILSAPLMIGNQRLGEANAHLLRLPGDVVGLGE